MIELSLIGIIMKKTSDARSLLSSPMRKKDPQMDFGKLVQHYP
jgi:hypothetical protein